MKYVVDASVVIKWYQREEELADFAQSLQRDFINHTVELVVPSLIYYEVGSVLTTAQRRFAINKNDLKQSLVSFYNLDFKVYQSETLLVAAYELTGKYPVSFYDAAYVALAQLLKIDLYTADKALVATVSKRIPLVHPLSDYPTS